ncbi:hypothetical protein [Gilliamella apis]|uniref:Uncharacterized protein n=1 Tax=Gilliamella apis TaxID=1970738 RepID=A0A2V4DP84_9GAMM|nr:hypothetical protein [Gilliamella apis]PXY91708.1 hypothetical protein DKK78_05150 [Gilliamella apis]WLS93288.1 hypothetical protein RAM17_08520 [Gilliamella apis]
MYTFDDCETTINEVLEAEHFIITKIKKDKFFKNPLITESKIANYLITHKELIKKLRILNNKKKWNIYIKPINRFFYYMILDEVEIKKLDEIKKLLSSIFINLVVYTSKTHCQVLLKLDKLVLKEEDYLLIYKYLIKKYSKTKKENEHGFYCFFDDFVINNFTDEEINEDDEKEKFRIYATYIRQTYHIDLLVKRIKKLIKEEKIEETIDTQNEDRTTITKEKWKEKLKIIDIKHKDITGFDKYLLIIKELLKENYNKNDLINFIQKNIIKNNELDVIDLVNKAFNELAKTKPKKFKIK